MPANPTMPASSMIPANPANLVKLANPVAPDASELAREATAAELRRGYGAGLRAVLAVVALAWQVLMLVPLLATLGEIREPLAAIGVWCGLTVAMAVIAALSRGRPLTGAEAAGITVLCVGAVLASLNVDNDQLLRIHNWPILEVSILLAFVTASRPAAQAAAATAVALTAIVVTVVTRGGTDPLTVSRLLGLAYGVLGLQVLVAMVGPLLRRTADTTAQAVRAEAETLAEQASDSMIRLERARWLGAIRDEVLPTLDTLAQGHGDPRDPRWRQRCARQAAVIRRMLARQEAGSTLATLAADMEAVVAAAEDRGMTVDVQIAQETGHDPLTVPLDLRAGLVDLLDRTLSTLPENRALLTLWNGEGGGSVFVSAAWPADQDPPALTGAVESIVDVDDGRLSVELRWRAPGED